MAFVNVRTPLKNLKTGDYFYPLTNLDQVITGNNRLSTFMSEDNNLLNLSNIGNLSSNGNISGNNGIFSTRLTVGSNTLNTNYNLFINGPSYINGKLGLNNYKSIKTLAYYNYGGSITGTIAIKLPLLVSEYDMPVFTIRIYEYNSTFGASEIIIGGHNWPSNGTYSWINSSYAVQGAYNKGVRLTNDGTNWFILLGTTSSTWSYPGIWIDVDAFYETYKDKWMDRDTTISVVTSESGYNNIITPPQTDGIFNHSIKVTSNGNTLTIGSLNSSWCHFENSVDRPFYFSHQISVNGNLLPYTNNNRLLGDSSHYWNKCYATNFYGYLNGSCSGSCTGVQTITASGDNIAALKSVWNSLPTNQTLGVYIAHGSASFFFGWRLAGYAVGSAYGGGIIDNYGNPDYVNISAGTFTAKHIWLRGDAVTSAVWNDYAENRCTSIDVNFGQVLMEAGDDTLIPTTERLSHFAGIASDTWGFSQGETETAKTPIAVAGRVLAYPYRDRNEYKPGDCLCAAPNGTVDIMTREEVRKYPDRIVGTVSCVPTYEEWGGGKDADREPVKVNGRIWVHVR